MVERSVRKTKFSQMARTTFSDVQTKHEAQMSELRTTLKIFIVKKSPLENVDITTSETLNLTVRLRIGSGNRLDVSTTQREKSKQRLE